MRAVPSRYIFMMLCGNGPHAAETCVHFEQPTTMMHKFSSNNSLITASASLSLTLVILLSVSPRLCLASLPSKAAMLDNRVLRCI